MNICKCIPNYQIYINHTHSIYLNKNNKAYKSQRKQEEKLKLFAIKQEPSKIGQSYIDQNPINLNQMSNIQNNRKINFEHEDKFQKIQIKFNKIKKFQHSSQTQSQSLLFQEDNKMTVIRFLKFVYKDEQVIIKIPQCKLKIQNYCSQNKVEMERTGDNINKFDSISQQTKQTNSVCPQLFQKEVYKSYNGYLSSIQEQQTTLFKRFTSASSNTEQESKRIQFISQGQTYHQSSNSSSNIRAKSSQYDEKSSITNKYDHYPTPPQSQQLITHQNYDQQRKDQHLNIIINQHNNEEVIQQQIVNRNRDNLQNNNEIIEEINNNNNEIDIATLSTNCTMNPAEDSSLERFIQQVHIQQLQFQNINRQQEQAQIDHQQTMKTMPCLSHYEEPFHVIRINFIRNRPPSPPPSQELYNRIIYNSQASISNYRSIQRAEINQRLNIYLMQMKEYMTDNMVGLYDQQRQQFWSILMSMRIQNYNEISIEFMKAFLTQFENKSIQKQNYYYMQQFLIRQKLQSIQMYHLYNDN